MFETPFNYEVICEKKQMLTQSEANNRLTVRIKMYTED